MRANLINLERAKLHCAGATGGDDRFIDSLIAACSEAVQKFCGRHFALRAWDELHDGFDPDGRLTLREYPVAGVESVRCGPRTVLEVANTSTAVNQQARVGVTDVGLELARVASGVKSLDTTVTWAACPTIHALATAVNALGNGWSARAAGSPGGDYGLWPSADLYVPPSLGDGTRSQGALDCRGRHAGLSCHVEELWGYAFDPRGWISWPAAAADLARWEDDGGASPAGGPPGAGPGAHGPGQWRVQYTAGYAEVPDDVATACALWVAHLWKLGSRDPLLAQTSESSAETDTGEGTTSATSTSASYRAPGGMPDQVRALISPYRRRAV